MDAVRKSLSGWNLSTCESWLLARLHLFKTFNFANRLNIRSNSGASIGKRLFWTGNFLLFVGFVFYLCFRMRHSILYTPAPVHTALAKIWRARTHALNNNIRGHFCSPEFHLNMESQVLEKARQLAMLCEPWHLPHGSRHSNVLWPTELQFPQDAFA